MSQQPKSHVIAGNSRLFVKEEHIGAALKKCVRSREARKTTTDDDNLGHYDEEEGDREDERAGMRRTDRGRT